MTSLFKRFFFLVLFSFGLSQAAFCGVTTELPRVTVVVHKLPTVTVVGKREVQMPRVTTLPTVTVVGRRTVQAVASKPLVKVKSSASVEAKPVQG